MTFKVFKAFFEAVKRVFAIAVILLDESVFAVCVRQSLINSVEIDISLINGSHAVFPALAVDIFKMNALYSFRKLFNQAYGVVSGKLNPVCVKNERKLVGGECFGKARNKILF